MPFFDQICRAALHYEFKTLQKLLKEGACIDEHKGFWTSAGWLGSLGHEGPVKFLISYGANPTRAAMGAAAAGNFAFAEALKEAYDISEDWIIQGAGMGGHEYALLNEKEDLNMYLQSLSYGGHEALLDKYLPKFTSCSKEYYLNFIYGAALQGHVKINQKLIDNSPYPLTESELAKIETRALLKASDEAYQKKYHAVDQALQYEMSILAIIFNHEEKYIENYIKTHPDSSAEHITGIMQTLIRYGHHTFMEKLLKQYPSFLSHTERYVDVALECGYLNLLEKWFHQYNISLHFTFTQKRLLKSRFSTSGLLLNALKCVENPVFFNQISWQIPGSHIIVPALNHIHDKKNDLNVNQKFGLAHPEIQTLLKADILKNKLTPTLFCLLLTFIYPMNYEDAKGVMGFFDRRRRPFEEKNSEYPVNQLSKNAHRNPPS